MEGISKIFQETNLLKQFISHYPCSPAPLRPNTSPKFCLVDLLQPPLSHSPLPFKIHAWATLFYPYKRMFPSQLILILCFGALIGYQRPLSTITSRNLSSALLDPTIIQQKLKQDLLSGRVIPAT